MDELQSIRFENKMEKGDYQELLYFNVFNRRRWVYWSAVALAAVCMYAVLQTLRAGGQKDMLFFVSLAYLALLALLLLQINMVSKRFAAQENAPANRPFVVDGEGIKSQNADGTQGLIAWESMAEAFETPGHFLFYVNARQALVFTKKSIGTSEGILCIRRLAAEKLGNRFSIRMKKKRGA